MRPANSMNQDSEKKETEMETTQRTITVKRNGIHILLVLITLMCLVSFVNGQPVALRSILIQSAPFSEPEARAFRDLIQSHEFDIFLDYHSFGSQIMYP